MPIFVFTVVLVFVLFNMLEALKNIPQHVQDAISRFARGDQADLDLRGGKLPKDPLALALAYILEQSTDDADLAIPPDSSVLEPVANSVASEAVVVSTPPRGPPVVGFQHLCLGGNG